MTQESQTGADVKAKFAPITEPDIQSQTDGGSFSKGRSYFRNGHIAEGVLRGATIQAECYGSDEEPYSVRATLPLAGEGAARKLTQYDCSCPRGGFCKHVVALLLTWAHKPEEFVVRPELSTLLQSKSREELAALALQMLERAPELESLLDLPPPVATAAPGAGRLRTVDPVNVRRQAARAFRRDTYEWGVASEIASDLESLRGLGDRYANSGQWANAQAVYTTVIEAIVEHYQETDDEGEIGSVAVECCEGLEKCLDAQARLPESERLEPKARAELLKTLFDLWRFDYFTMGGIDLSHEVPEVVARNVTEAERAQVEAWLREAMQAEEDEEETDEEAEEEWDEDEEWEEEEEDEYAEGPAAAAAAEFGSEWRNRTGVDFLLTLKRRSGVSDAEMLAEYRKYGLYAEMTDLLLEHDRIEEALRVAREHLAQSYSLLQFAGKLMAKGGAWIAQTFDLIEGRLREAERAGNLHEVGSYLQWLGQRYLEQGMPSEAFSVEMRRFENSPAPETFQTVQRAAQQADPSGDLWTETRARLIADLEQRDSWSALAQIYLQENEVRAALDAISHLDENRERAYFGGYWIGDIRLRVAEAAEKPYPEEARRIYEQHAEALIDRRGRDNYQAAAGYLARVKRLYEAQGLGALWQDYIRDLRARNTRLTALKEELNAAGL